MKRQIQARRKVITVMILLSGIVAGVLIHVFTPNPPEDLLADQANSSKEYVRQMEEYGGSFNVVAEQFREWFVGLWQGKTLGITVACLSALVAAVAYVGLTPTTIDE